MGSSNSHSADIVLATLNAKYAHASFGLRYLMANLGDDLRGRAVMLEFEISQRPTDVVERILSRDPRIVGIGVYIWNAHASAQVVAELKRIAPHVIVIIGGPEVSFELDEQPICRDADYIITNEADLAFAELCRDLLLRNRRPLVRVIDGGAPGLDRVALPYELYDATDLAQRVVYVEASRGCPFECEFCLSSLDVPVRNVPLDAFLASMQSLLDRGLSRFKFVDRTFNLNLSFSRAILEFFLARFRPGLFLHFEMIPDRLPDALRDVIARFPPGALQFEVGIQTFNDDVAALISRRQDNVKVESNLRWLREATGVHVHADLIVGLPGEDLDSFGRGFDRLIALGPQEIQVGMLKRLRGTPIARHDEAWRMAYSPNAPYEILRTKLIGFPDMQRMRRFARYWDLVANSGNFVETTPMIWSASDEYPTNEAVPTRQPRSAFTSFLSFSDWLFAYTSQTHAIALPRLAELVFEHLTQVAGHPASKVAPVLWRDYARGHRGRDLPEFLRPFIARPDRRARVSGARSLPVRQSRHLGGPRATG